MAFVCCRRHVHKLNRGVTCGRGCGTLNGVEEVGNYLRSGHKEQCNSLQNSCLTNQSEALVNPLVSVWLDVLKSG